MPVFIISKFDEDQIKNSRYRLDNIFPIKWPLNFLVVVETKV